MYLGNLLRSVINLKNCAWQTVWLELGNKKNLAVPSFIATKFAHNVCIFSNINSKLFKEFKNG